MVAKLPAYESPVLGRQVEIEALLALMRQGAKVVTLTGPGGVGKSRLAVEVASQWQQQSGRPVCFVSLAALDDPTRVPIAIALALDLQDTGSIPVVRSLKDYLHNRRELIVLDNFEHVKSAVNYLSEFLEVAPDLRFLVTSRSPLRLAEESEFPVPPLVLPDLDNLPSTYMLSNYAAVALFIQRAQLANPAFMLTQANAAEIAEICVRLDGLPLAIELAAARVQSVPPRSMRERLQARLMLLIGNKQLQPRHRSLRAAIDWSYDLLSAPQLKMFRRLAVFAGSGSWAAIHAVCNEAQDIDQAAETLQSLVEQNLVRAFEREGEVRYALLETVREYALEKLAEEGETAQTYRQLALYFAQLAETAELKLRSAEQQGWLTLLETELDNLRTVLSWSLDMGEAGIGLRLAASLDWFWFVRGHVAEGRDWLERLLGKAAGLEAGLRGKSLNALAHLTMPSDISTSQRYSDEALALWSTLGNPRGLADAHYSLARSLANRGDAPEQALDHYQKSLKYYLEQEYSPGVADAWFALGVQASNQGDYERALMHYTQCLNLRREEGDSWGMARVLSSLAFTTADMYDFAAARRYGEESLALYQLLGDRASAAALTLNQSYIENLQGRPTEAARLAQQALAIWTDTGRQMRAVSAYQQLAQISITQSHYAQATNLAMQGLSLSQRAGFTRGIGWMLNVLAQVALYEGNLDEAEHYFPDCLDVNRRAGDKLNQSVALTTQGLVALGRGKTTEARQALSDGLTLLQTTGEKMGLTHLLEAFTQVLKAEGQTELAVKIWAATQALRKQLGAPLELNRQPAYQQDLDEARLSLGETFEPAWRAGAALSLEQAVALTL